MLDVGGWKEEFRVRCLAPMEGEGEEEGCVGVAGWEEEICGMLQVITITFNNYIAVILCLKSVNKLLLAGCTVWTERLGVRPFTWPV